ncbi:nicotinamide N-methyltransferase-like isoform X2 [Hyla sarda]|uniref:nicotinamide N-methyltransferase-like isoform X2 n=1 Tax=Hyla sarda TaxID=327740 RepID=UPI0024C44E6C|nr:nicotinamide N-methyltransferase-like isoform X2 [Hyla sarda]
MALVVQKVISEASSREQNIMASTFTSQQTYIDEFNPIDYLQTYYVPGDGLLFGEWTDFVLQNLHETFSKGGVKGETLLDFGTGPTIYQLLSACEVFDKIIVSDFLEQNCAELQKWLKKDPDAFDWTHIIKFVCELEGNRENCEQKAEKLRSKVKEVLKCDALKRNPYDPVVVPPVDCLLSCLCLEAPCKDIESYCNVLKNFQALIKPGGHLLILSALNATFYYVGKKYFDAMTTRKEELEQAFQEAGYEIEKAVYSPRIDKSRMDIADYDTSYFIHARKLK